MAQFAGPLTELGLRARVQVRGVRAGVVGSQSPIGSGDSTIVGAGPPSQGVGFSVLLGAAQQFRVRGSVARHVNGGGEQRGRGEQ